jgi:DNA-binding MarR family transcriptional regulator
MTRAADKIPFRQTIPFRMHRATALTVARASNEFAQYGTNVHGARVLVVALQNPGIRVGDLAEITCIEPSTLSHMLRRFERDRIITRTRPPEDNRSVNISLTDSGLVLARKIHNIVMRHQESLLKGISASDIVVFSRVLDRMTLNVAD